MIRETRDAVDALPTIDLSTMDRLARLHTRKDRKYVVGVQSLRRVLARVRPGLMLLEIDGRRWFGYHSLYFDTPDLDAYRLAATHRPNRFKVRTRTYLDAGKRVLEVKTKDQRGRTVKRRHDLADDDPPLDPGNRRWLAEQRSVGAFVNSLEPRLLSRYQRATLVLPDDRSRATIDADWTAAETDGCQVSLGQKLIIETKTSGQPSLLDRELWAEGHRPIKVSKYATALAALHPELPSNRWHQVLKHHVRHSPTLPSTPSPAPTSPPPTGPRPHLAATTGGGRGRGGGGGGGGGG
jgi:hypothetical protein